jgi:hypothetical protein
MRLPDIVTVALNGAAAKLKRDAIAIAIMAVGAIGVLIMLTGASVLWLEPQVGMVYARLIVAAFFALMVVAAIVWMHVVRARAQAISTPPLRATGAAGPDPVQRQAQFAQIAMIIEAVLLGYSLSRRSDRR